MKRRRYAKGDVVYFPSWDGEKGFPLRIEVIGFHKSYVKFRVDGVTRYADESYCYPTEEQCLEYIDNQYKAFLIERLVEYGKNGRQ